MRGMPFNLGVEGKGALEAPPQDLEANASFWGGFGHYLNTATTNINNSKKRKQATKEGFLEPQSVLDNRSPSPSTSTLSSSLGSAAGGSSDSAAGVAAPALSDAKWESVPPPPPPPDLHPVDWEAMLSDPSAVAAAASSGQDQTFLRWIMADIDDPNAASAAAAAKHQPLAAVDQSLGFDPGNFAFEPVPPSLPPLPATMQMPMPMMPPMPGAFYQDPPPMEEKHLLFHPQNPSFFLPSFEAPPSLLPPQPKRHQPPLLDLSANLRHHQGFPPHLNVAPPFQFHHRPMKPKVAGDEAAMVAAHQQALVDQLFKAAELVEAGNSISARGILARLNHQLPSPQGKPLFRSAFYFKEALLNLLLTNTTTTTTTTTNSPLSTPLDVLLKLGTYKSFSEISPIVQFTNFTCIQAILEELGSADRIHIIDFDVGVGGHWSSFMQELAQQRSAATGASPLLKITAFACPGSHHPLELHLTRENLSHFAADLNIPFEFNILSVDTFDPSMVLAMSAGVDEAIAVNFPIGSGYHSSIPGLLRLVKQLNPKIVVSVDHGCDRSDLPFAQHFLHAFQSCTVLLDSVDASGASSDVASKIERYLVQPRVESAVLGRHRLAGNNMLPWKSMFASAGFAPVQFSNFTETQAECLLKRVQVRGFQVEKRQSSLFLCWQRGELVSVSAWRC